MPSETGDEGALPEHPGASSAAEADVQEGVSKVKDSVAENGNGQNDQEQPTPPNAQHAHEEPRVRQPAKADEPFEKWEREEMEKLLQELRGHLGKPYSCNH